MKIKKIIYKYKWIILLFIITIVRFLITTDLPSYFFNNLRYDDSLMLNLSSKAEWLGDYYSLTLIKGPIYPLFLKLCDFLHCSYSFANNFIYIGACIFVTYCCKDLFKKRKYLIILYLLLLWNPVSYSMELFQRLYRNSLSLSETLVFFGCIVKIISSKKSNIVYEILLGVISAIMLLTREDTIWIYIILILLFIYQVIKKHKFKNILLYAAPVITIVIALNVVSAINYHYYKVYTYNELSSSSFKDAYINIQRIKDDNKVDKVSITKQSLYALADNSSSFGISRKEIDILYEHWIDKDREEINNGNIIWAIRQLVYLKFKFENGQDANNYWKKLSAEIEDLFEDGKLEKEFVIPSVFMNTPSLDNVISLPKNLMQAIYYTSTYKNIRSISGEDIKFQLNGVFDEERSAYKIFVRDYHDAENINTYNITIFNIIRSVYILLIPILSLVSLYMYLKNIRYLKNIDTLVITSLLLLSYFIIIGGVIYTEVTAFKAIRYTYLAPIYLIQILFIVITLEGESYEGINYFNALFKRRKNN